MIQKCCSSPDAKKGTGRLMGVCDAYEVSASQSIFGRINIINRLQSPR